jgi:hypothetical protein
MDNTYWKVQPALVEEGLIIAGGGGRVDQAAGIDVLCREITAGRRKLLVEMAGYTTPHHP